MKTADNFYYFILFLGLQRLAELVVSAKNQKWLLQNGAVEIGKGHYPMIVLLHIFFIISLVVEYIVKGDHHFEPYLLGGYLFLFLIKIWVILSLGRHWNTRIYYIPGGQLIRRGLYKYVKHPNYFIVIMEIALIPLMFHLYLTALVFSVLNAVVLAIRIREEEKIFVQ